MVADLHIRHLPAVLNITYSITESVRLESEAARWLLKHVANREGNTRKVGIKACKILAHAGRSQDAGGF